jgi:hypothetical protein
MYDERYEWIKRLNNNDVVLDVKMDVGRTWKELQIYSKQVSMYLTVDSITIKWYEYDSEYEDQSVLHCETYYIKSNPIVMWQRVKDYCLKNLDSPPCSGTLWEVKDIHDNLHDCYITLDVHKSGSFEYKGREIYLDYAYRYHNASGTRSDITEAIEHNLNILKELKTFHIPAIAKRASNAYMYECALYDWYYKKVSLINTVYYFIRNFEANKEMFYHIYYHMVRFGYWYADWSIRYKDIGSYVICIDGDEKQLTIKGNKKQHFHDILTKSNIEHYRYIH